MFTKQTTTESNVNLSLPRNFSARSVDWDNFMSIARESIEKSSREKQENFPSIEPRSLSINSDPDPTKSRISTISSISQFSQDGYLAGNQRRDTIRNIMYRAKHDNLSRGESSTAPSLSTPVKCVIPTPVPKNIPNEILDNVQLFEFYYNNLSSLNSLNSNVSQSSDNSNDAQNSDEPSNTDNRTSTNRLSLSRILSFNKPQKSNSRLCRMSAFDESTSDDSSIPRNNEIK